VPPASRTPSQETAVTTDELLAVLDRHHREVREMKRRHQSAVVAVEQPLPLFAVPPELSEDTGPKLSRQESARRLADLCRERFGRSA
jgi:hypothetical protein